MQVSIEISGKMCRDGPEEAATLFYVHLTVALIKWKDLRKLKSTINRVQADFQLHQLKSNSEMTHYITSHIQQPISTVV